jgi:outer membrane protein OmpA-like peptidoglycan-associated protein
MKLKYITLSENKLPESRLLTDGQKEKINNKVIKKKKTHNENKLEKINKKELKSKEKTVLKKNHKFKVNFMQEEEKPSVEEIKIFYNNLAKLNKKGSITIKGYAQKSESDSTSKVRRLSLKRALFLRSLLLKENYNITQIYVKALGHDNELKGNKDIVIITNN